MDKNPVQVYQVETDNKLIILKGNRVTINQNDCEGCGKCVAACPMDVIRISERKAIPFGEAECILCELCVRACKQRAIFLHYNWRNAIGVAKRHGKKVSL